MIPDAIDDISPGVIQWIVFDTKFRIGGRSEVIIRQPAAIISKIFEGIVVLKAVLSFKCANPILKIDKYLGIKSFGFPSTKIMFFNPLKMKATKTYFIQ